MATTQQREQPKDTEQHARDEFKGLVGEQVIQALGRPAGLLKVQVRLLWEDYFRVNVLVGEDAASAKVANSYFLKIDSNGKVVESTPKITRQH